MNKQQIFKICKADNDITERRDKTTITVEVFNTPLSTIDRTTRQKTSKDIDLTSTMNQKIIIGIYRTPNHNKIHILFNCPWNINQNRPYPGPQNKHQHFLKVKIMQNVF